MKKVSLFLAIAFCLFAFSCKKNNDQGKQISPAGSISAQEQAVLNKIKIDAQAVLSGGTKAGTKRTTGVYSVDPSNPLNPYDYTGVQHNAILDYIISFAPALASNVPMVLYIGSPQNPPLGNNFTFSTYQEKTTGLSVKYCIDNYDSYLSGYQGSQSDLMLAVTNNTNLFISNKFTPIDPNNYAATEPLYLQSVSNDLQLFATNGTGGYTPFEAQVDNMLASQLFANSLDLADVISLIEVYDNDIQNPQLDPGIVARQLKMYSILRYSCAYWEMVGENANSPWLQFMPAWFDNGVGNKYAMKETRLKWWQYLLVGYADAVSGAIGATFTAGIGAVAGGAVSAYVQDVFAGN